MDITSRLNNLSLRRSDRHFVSDRAFESVEKSLFSENTDFLNLNEHEKWKKYVLDSMAEVPKRSTDISFEEGEKVKNHLLENLGKYNLSAEIKFQGSVINNTHIKGNSDIDLLVITDKYITLEKPQIPKNPYDGEPLDDLDELRSVYVKILRNIYSCAKVDDSGAKSIKLSGGSLRRDIDVVPSNWFYSNLYKQNPQCDYYKGVQVFDKKKRTRNENYPFYNMELLRRKDKDSSYLYKSLVRLAKNIRCDSEYKKVQNISSYDIQAIFYHMRNECFHNLTGIDIIPVATEYLNQLIKNPEVYNILDVPDGTRRISDKLSIDELSLLYKEFNDINSVLSHSTFNKILSTMNNMII